MEITNDEIAMLFAVGFWVVLVVIELIDQEKIARHSGVRKFVRRRK